MALKEDAALLQDSAVTQVQFGLILFCHVQTSKEVLYGCFGHNENEVPLLSSLSESCTVDSDCLGEVEASDPSDSSAGSSPAELLLRLLHVATRGQTEY